MVSEVWKYQIPFCMAPNGGYELGGVGMIHADLEGDNSSPEYDQWWMENAEEHENTFNGGDQGHVIFHPEYGEIWHWPSAFEVSQGAKERLMEVARRQFAEAQATYADGNGES